MGHNRANNAIIVGTKDGATRAYAIKRMPEGQRWCRADIKSIRGTPQQPNPNAPGMHIPIQINFDPHGAGAVRHNAGLDAPAEGERQIKGTKITQEILAKYGYSDKCEGCRPKRAGLRQARPHAEECK